jgi:putative transposase
MLNRRLKSQEEHAYLIDIISQIRNDHPTMNSRYMYHMINPHSVGRDKFEALCKEWGFLSVRPINYHRTTNSSGVVRFDNLLTAANINGINQAFVSDITYYQMMQFYYITFILDAYSRYIVGYSVSDRLTTEKTTLPALQMAIRHRKQLPENIIFHSDGGGQYYDKDFLALTKKYKFKNSMCENPQDNGTAERINGVIKNNYLKHWKADSYKQLVNNVDRAVSLYNNEKPHGSLKKKTPREFELEQLNLLCKQS